MDLFFGTTQPVLDAVADFFACSLCSIVCPAFFASSTIAVTLKDPQGLTAMGCLCYEASAGLLDHKGMGSKLSACAAMSAGYYLLHCLHCCTEIYPEFSLVFMESKSSKMDGINLLDYHSICKSLWLMKLTHRICLNLTIIFDGPNISWCHECAERTNSSLINCLSLKFAF